MLWEILWALILGFGLSAIIQAVASKRQMSKFLPDDSPKSLAIATGLGAASSSCSYASVAIARSLFRKGANFTSAIVFEFASTNLVIELGIIMWLLLGWQFTLAEFIGGPVMILILVIIFRLYLKKSLIEKAKKQADKGIVGIMEGHAEMDMSQDKGTLFQKATSKQGVTSISHYFVMDWISVWKDITLGLLIAGALAAWVPNSFWQSFFITSNQTIAVIWGPIIGPIVSMISFVCSIGNVPLAAVLWNGGISFGGVIAFIYADLLILPILNIYRKYYGIAMTVFLTVSSYVAIVLAGFFTEILFGYLHLIPTARHALEVSSGITLNYTSFLNVVFLVLAGLLLARFYRTGGVKMLRMMSNPSEHNHEHIGV
jgi:uncharacterized membrane protein YraQ (UPF0718 family)